MKTPNPRILAKHGLLPLLLISLIQSAQAVDSTWNGFGIDDNWSTGLNWSSPPPAAGNALVFGGATRLTPNNDTAANTIYSGITFDNTSGAFNLGGNAITLGGDVVNNDADLQTISMSMILNGTRLFNATSGPIQMGGTAVLDLNGNNATFNCSARAISSASTTTITDSAAGTGTSVLSFIDSNTTNNNQAALITDGATRKVGLKISNNQHYYNLLTNANSTFSGGTVLANSATGTRFLINSYTPTLSAGTLTNSQFGTGAITIGESATDKASLWLQFGAPTTFYNDITFNTPTGLDANWKGIAITSNNITFAGTQTANLADAIYETFTGGGQSATITGQITGSQALSVGPVAFVITMTLANAAETNDYAGDTKVGQSGVVILGANNQIPDGPGKGNVNVLRTLRLNGFNETINGLTGTVAGTVQNNSATTASTLTLGANDTTASFAGNISNGSTAPLAITKIGTGTQTFTGTNTYTGTTTISAGALEIGSINALQNSPLATATGNVTMGVGITAPVIGGLNGSRDLSTVINSGYGTITSLTLNPQAGAYVTYSGNITDGALGMTVTKTGAGIQVLSGINTYTGNTTISGGVLAVAGKSSLPGWNVVGRYSVGANAAIAVANEFTDADIGTMLATGNYNAAAGMGFYTEAGDRTYSPNLTGAGGLAKVGANTLTLTGTTTYTGATAISGGTLKLGSALTTSAALTMTNAAILDLNGNNATFTDTTNPGSTTSAASLITDNAAGSGTSTLRFVDGGLNGTSNGAITDGATRKIAVEISNVQGYTQRLKSSNSTYSGGTLVDNNVSGSRFQISSYNPTLVGPTLTQSEFGTGAITIGQSATDKASMYFDTGTAGKTFYNGITFNTPNGLDANWKGVAFNVPGITLAGTQTANLADAIYETFTFPSQTATITGQITGSQGLSVGPLAYILNLTLASTPGTNDYVGDTKVGVSSIVTLGANDQIPDGPGKGNVNVLYLSPSNIGTLRLNGYNETINGLNGATNSRVQNNSATTASTLTLGAGDATATFAGTLADGGAAKLALVKTGTGTQTLSGISNSYTGDTTVNAGTLEIYEPYLAAASSVSLGAAAVLNLNFWESEEDVTATVDTLFIDGVQQPAGIYGATGSGATTVNDVNFVGIGTLTVSNGPSPTSGYAAWQAANSTTQAANLDHDKDGVSNGVEHFLGGTGNTTGFTPLPGVTNTAGTLSVTWVRHPDFPGFPGNYGTAVIVETSATLANPWTPAVVGVGAGFVEITGNNVKYTFPAGTKNFARLKVVP